MKKYTVFFVLLFCSFITSIILILLTGEKLEKIIVRYSTNEVQRIANVILNDVIVLDDDVYNNNFFDIVRDNNGNISLIDFDSKVTNNILKDINTNALKKLTELEKGNSKYLNLSDSLKGTRLTYLDSGIVCDIPLGVLLNNSLLVNFTTSIPIRFSFIGTVSSNMYTNVKEYGFNNALIEVGVKVTIKEQITMPHSTKIVPITTKINLVTQVIQGQVPIYYNNGFSNSSATFSTKIF